MKTPIHELKGDALTWALDERNQKHWRKLERNQYITWVLFAGFLGGTPIAMHVLGVG